MSYVPLNPTVFTSAFTGAFSALAVGGRNVTSKTSTDYDAFAVTAGQWAQEFDTAWGANAANDVVLKTVMSASFGAFEGRNSTNPSANYTVEVLAVIASITSELAYYAAQGIIPPSGGSSAYLTQATWNIDPTNGNDSNTGLTAVTALKTWAEMDNRLGPEAKIPQATNIFILGNLPSTDPINIRFLPIGGNIKIYGGPTTAVGSGATTIRSGVLSSVVAAVPATNTPWQAVDVAVADWTAMLGARLRVTAGARINNMTYPAKDLGGGAGAAAARLSPPSDGTYSVAGAIANTDPYVIETLVSVTPGAIISDASSALFTISFFDLTINAIASNPNVGIWASATTLLFFGCIFDTFLFQNTTAVIAYRNCLFNPANHLTEFSSQCQFVGGLFLNATNLFLGGGVLLFSIGVMFQGGNGVQHIGGTINLNSDTSVFDSGLDGYTMKAGSNTAANGTFTGVLYGSGNAGHGLSILSGLTLKLFAVPTIASTGAIFALGNSSGNCRGFDEATGLYTAPIAPTTWANFVDTLLNGGFASSAHNLAANAHLTAA